MTMHMSLQTYGLLCRTYEYDNYVWLLQLPKASRKCFGSAMQGILPHCIAECASA